MKKIKFLITILLCGAIFSSLTACNLNEDVNKIFNEYLQFAGITHNEESGRYSYVLNNFNGSLTTKIEKPTTESNFVTVVCAIDKNNVSLSLKNADNETLFNNKISNGQEFVTTVELYSQTAYLNIDALEESVSGLIVIEFSQTPTINGETISLTEILGITSLQEFNLNATSHNSKYTSSEYQLNGETLGDVLEILNVEYTESTFDVNEYLSVEDNDYELLVTFDQTTSTPAFYFFFIENTIYALTGDKVYSSVSAYDEQLISDLFFFDTWRSANFEVRKSIVNDMPNAILEKTTEEITAKLGTPNEIDTIILETYPEQFGGYVYYYYLEEFTENANQEVYAVTFDKKLTAVDSSVLNLTRTTSEQSGLYTLTVSGDTHLLLEDLLSTYQKGSVIEIKTSVILDADIEIYLNGVKVDKTHYDSDYWGYTFTMPEAHSEITINVVGGI